MRFLAFLALLLAPPALACSPVEPVESAVHLSSVNSARARSGLAPIALDSGLSRMAQGHACDMAALGYFDHTAPDGSGLFDRARQTGLSGFCQLAENIAHGPRDIPTVMGIWLRSPDHRANLLDPNLTHVGFGRAAGPHWVQVFGGRC
ncbi:CAP domain-containing protein [Roseibaca sp. V10]|uniref:CAP domain-containing protein n=1 Tax=Roseinatronobacter domitianus TaxID=2940293 RepID=A0ABT0M0W3_9RHOB|nr:CAP domain-containing protein [Roseibaca domitiana]MCL1628501.1 CAP domain-containing protein [Roseibaca domitiana]